MVLTPTIARLRAAACDRVLAKTLAENDNSKNQIYLGGSFDVLNSLPFRDSRSELSGTREILKASVNWQWLQIDGGLVPAPRAQLILYPQYPEVRLSGILKGVPRGSAPTKLVANRIANRVLLMGIRRDGAILATVLAPENREAIHIANATQRLDGPGALVELITTNDAVTDTEGVRDVVLNELLRIHNLGWIPGKRMRADGSTISYAAANGVGYTLEAELGISPNGFAAPDFMGWEIKGLTITGNHGVQGSKRITLMTPNPNGGEFAEMGPIGFVTKYGYADRTIGDRRNFGGIFRSGRPVGNPTLLLGIDGYSPASTRHRLAEFHPSGTVNLRTVDNTIAASWSLPKMIEHWNKKHARAIYFPATTDRGPSGLRYKYGPKAYLGEGTDFSRMLDALALGSLVYDPGLKLEHAGTLNQKIKQRHQFRMAFADLPTLYERWEEIDLDSLASASGAFSA